MSALHTFLAQAPFLDPGGGGEESGRVSLRAFAAVLGAGFLIATIGHVVRMRALVAFGIALIFGATVFVPALLAIAD
jgi:hypothetical protein